MTDLPQNGGSFYTSASSVLIDPFVSPPTMQSQMASELARCEDLVRRDLRYAHLVAGASKMPMNTIWVARNQGGDVNDRDLASLRDVAWNEFVKKRFLPSVAEGTPVADAAASMLEIVRSMNLQRRRFQIMGLHEQVEASELQFVLHLCQAGLLHTSEYRVMANRFRRHDQFFEAFALAVGAFVCASAPFTLGVATTQLNRSLQYDYKKHTIALFVFVLQQNRALIAQCGTGLDEDYVARIARLIIVSQETGVAGHRQEEECCDNKRGGGRISEEFLRSTIDSVQRLADRVERTAERVDRDLAALRDTHRESRGARDGVGRGGQAHGSDTITRQIENQVNESIKREMRRIGEGHVQLVETLKRENEEFKKRANVQMNRIADSLKEMESFQKQNMAVGLEQNESFAVRLKQEYDVRNKQLSDEVNDSKIEIGKLSLDLRNEIFQHVATLDNKFDNLSVRLTRDIHTSLQSSQAAVQTSVSVVPAQSSSLTYEQIQSIVADRWDRIAEAVKSELKTELMSDFTGLMDGRISNFLTSHIQPNFNELKQTLQKYILSLQTEDARIANECSMVISQQRSLEMRFAHLYEITKDITEFARRAELEPVFSRLGGFQVSLSELITRVDNLTQWMDEISFSPHDSGEVPAEINRRKSDNAVGAGVLPSDVRRIADEAISQWAQNGEIIPTLATAVRSNRDFDSGIELIVNSKISTYMSTMEARLRNLESSRPSTADPPNFNTFQILPASSAQYSSATTTRPATGDGS